MTTPDMPYRRLGRSGLKVSVLSFGSWVSFGTQLDTGMARDCLAAAHEAGVNFFDNAEAYAGGESERIMGAAIAELGWARESYVVSSKFFWGLTEGVNTRNTLNRKYLMQAIDGSLERFGLDFLDVVYCHRADPDTPIEETVEAMSDIIESGRAHYWGTSEWTADEIRAAWDIADRRNLRKPITEQPQYHLFERRRGVFNHVVQQGCHQGLRVKLPGRANAGNGQRMGNVFLAAGAHLALMRGVAINVGSADALNIGGLEVARENRLERVELNRFAG